MQGETKTNRKLKIGGEDVCRLVEVSVLLYFLTGEAARTPSQLSGGSTNKDLIGTVAIQHPVASYKDYVFPVSKRV